MGKASKWLINFLLGRKDDKGKKNNISMSFEDHGSSMVIPSASPFRRIWSFGKTGTKSEVQARKSSRSFHPMSSSLDMVKQHAYIGVVSMATYEAFLKSKAIEDAAATRIQAAFRSYLARRALHALKGLVKLQAVVRGHLVRKQTTATLRCMHALMAIQVRTRVERIRMASESHLAPKSRLSRNGRFPLETGFKTAQKDGKRGTVKSLNGFTNRSKTERIKQVITRCCFSEELSISKEKQNYEEFSFTTPNSPRHCPPLKSKPTTPGRSSFTSSNYMANTQSSRAKVRSQSEPKQRPASNFKAKGKRTTSAEEINDNNMKQQLKVVANENREPDLSNFID